MLKAENSSLEKQLQQQLTIVALYSSLQQRSTTSFENSSERYSGLQIAATHEVTVHCTTAAYSSSLQHLATAIHHCSNKLQLSSIAKFTTVV
jgi:hypothetical protein